MTPTMFVELARARGGACAVGPGARVGRGALAAVAASIGYAAATSGRWWCAVPAGACAVFLAVGAVTGWCPTALLRRDEPVSLPAAHGYPDARHVVRLSAGRP